jgi:hypothetical protein
MQVQKGSSKGKSTKSPACDPRDHVKKEPFVTLTTAAPTQYKRPDPWVIDGQKLQLADPKPRQRSMTITIGVDFGTAFTKASVGMMDKIFIVNWSGIQNGTREFTLQGEFSVLGNGTCVLGHAPTAKKHISNLKKPFLKDIPSAEEITNATLFLALVIRYIRAWIFYYHSGLIGDRKVIWSLNIGIPSKPAENIALRKIYHDLALSSWRLSFQNKSISISGAKRVRPIGDIELSDNLESVDVVPEFVAQIASYIRSPQRQPDLHMIMDIGAGTVDVATFNVHQSNGEDVFPIFSSAVEPLGTHFLNERRFSLLKRGKSIDWDDFSPTLTALEFSKRFSTTRAKVALSDREHITDVAEVIYSVINETRTRRYRLSRNWESGIRVFFCGGGSECDVFSNALEKAALQHGVTLKKTPLPVPRNLEANGLDNQEFHRVAVAYGLGIYAANLGKITLASEIEDDLPPPRIIRERPDRDELYPK